MNEMIERNQKTRQNLIQHYKNHPDLQAEDIFKYLFQSAFGCEHLVSNEDAVLNYIEREYTTLSKEESLKIEPLDGEYSRVYLSCLNEGLTAKTLAKLFCLSAKKEENGKALLEEKIQVAKELVASGILPLDRDEFAQKLATWQELGYPAVHHSDAFRKAYRPAYRVIANRYVEIFSMFVQMDKRAAKSEKILQKTIVIGCPGSGKTTFAEKLKGKTNLPLFYLDAIWHKPDKTHIPREEYDARLAEILALDTWIIDGNYGRTLESRLSACDTVFLFDLPVEVCLEGAISRIGKKREEMPWIETEFDPEFEQQIKEFPSKELPKIYALLGKYPNKDVYIFKTRQQADSFLEGLPIERSTL